MVETVFLDWGISFGSGVLFALAGRRELDGATSRLRTRAFRWGFAYLHLGVLAISVALYALNRDWMWMYWVDPRTLPVGLEALTFLLYEICFVAGFLLAAEVGRAGAWLLAAATAAGILVLEATARTRLFRFGTLEEFRAGTAAPAVDLSPFAVRGEWWLAGIGGGVSLVALIVVLRRLTRENTPRRSAAAA